MKQNKSAKRSLAFSVLSLLLCCAMLVGTTFAWFTDSVTSGNNKIVAGNLDVELYHNADANVTTIENKVDENTMLFVQNLWEPGVAVFENFKVANEGTLALKYQLMINFTNAVKTPSGKTLADVLKVGVVENGVSGNRDAVVGAVTTWEPLATFALEGKLEANENDIYGVVIWWEPSDIDDEFNMNNENKGTVLSIDLGVSLIATQVEAERDAFGDDYDKDTTLPELIEDNAELKDALTADVKDIIVTLTNDVTWDVAAWAQNAMGGASTETITINGNGYTINFNQTNSDWNNITAGDGIVLTINDAKVTNSGHNDGPWNRHDLNFDCEVVMNNVTSDKAMAFKNSATLNNVTIDDANTSDTYAIWVSPRTEGQTITLNNCVIDMLDCTDGRGIKIDNQYVNAADEKLVTLNVSNTTFKTEEKSAILVKTTLGANITLNNVDIANTLDPLHEVWVDEAAEAAYDLVTVTGGVKVLESDITVGSNALDAALKDNETVTLQLATGNYTLPNVKGATVTLIGAGNNTVVDCSHMGGYQEVANSSFVFKDLTVVYAEAGFPYKGLQHITGVTYENCHIIGTVNLFAPATFKNCTFDSKSAEHNVVTYGSDNVTFENCKFTYGDRSVNCYAENASARNVNVTFTNCEFTKVAGKATTGAIETNSMRMNSLTLTINGCTVNEGDLWWISSYDNLGGAKTTVKVDGKYSFATGEQLRAFAANATGEVELVLAKDITLGNDTETCMAINFEQATKVVIDGNGKTLTLKGKAPYPDTAETYVAGIVAANADITVKNLTINNEKLASNGTKTSADRDTVYTFVRGKSANFEKVTFNGGINVRCNTTFTECNFSASYNMHFALFVDNQYGSYNGLTVSVNNCTFKANGAHGNVKVADDTLGGVTLNIKDCTFMSENLQYPDVSWNASKNYVDADVKVTGKVAVNVTGTNSFTYGVMANVENGGATYNGDVMTYNTIYGK